MKHHKGHSSILTEVMVAALRRIAEHVPESDEWEGAAFFLECQKIAYEALVSVGEPVKDPCEGE